MLNLNLKGAELFVRKAQSSHVHTFWENYDLMIWNKNNSGFYSKIGMFKNNAWGLTERFTVNEDGVWKLPIKYVKVFKK